MSLVIAGAGLFGCTLANTVASRHDLRVTVIERRKQIGGNCFSCTDQETGIEYHKYGSHIFHTSDESVWKFVNRFSRFNNYQHRVFTTHNGAVYQLPVNLQTINSYFKQNFTPYQARAFIHSKCSQVSQPFSNFEEMAVASIGRELYEAFFMNYTKKQWGKDPAAIPAGVFGRLPVRFNYDNRYFSDQYQGIPVEGYTSMLTKMLACERIRLILGKDLRNASELIRDGSIVVYCGAIDSYFGHRLGKLEWRGVRFGHERHDISDYQGTAVMNYADVDVPFTRKHEFRHLHPERDHGNKTLVFTEYPITAHKEDDYAYPMQDAKNTSLYNEYLQMAKNYPNIHFCGRLGQYAYLDMDDTVKSAFAFYENTLRPLICKV